MVKKLQLVPATSDIRGTNAAYVGTLLLYFLHIPRRKDSIVVRCYEYSTWFHGGKHVVHHVWSDGAVRAVMVIGCLRQHLQWDTQCKQNAKTCPGHIPSQEFCRHTAKRRQAQSYPYGKCIPRTSKRVVPVASLYRCLV